MAQFRTSKLDYTGLIDFLGNKTQKILGHNTLAYKEGESIKVQYHDTVIVTLLPDQTTFSNGGFYTPTTKQRINEFMPYGYHVSQSKGLWYVYQHLPKYQDIGIFDHTCTFDLTENKFTGLKVEGIERSNAIKQIKAYCKAYMIDLTSGNMESPSNSDCWYCSLFNSNSWDSHLESHIDESYYVPSLILRAIDYQDKMSIIAKSTVQMLWNKEKDIPQTFIDTMSEQGYKTLFGYMLHCYDHKDK